ncbi:MULTISPECIES: tyrosine-type recombinase/integrase [Enterobacteriaceae]|uniref:Tyrosine recombinase XerC n=5 Tax=Gammaproteobacteria TaxID=1236 RepID=A0A2U7XWR6_KLEPN|nr:MULTISPECIES: site-specific integrase [Enterobacteriaceae]HBM3274387.1 tyrosine-type recombinase/integrase [Klebsiella michiganensis]HBQ5559100.1 tyrosine-type recombinase/integrase [Klebsiella variicola]HBW8876129.1 tyrosine-type recombinase/integrase [Klebsiella quasipneumoniae subsp. similipneumoniae]AVX52198.1 Tyrosine recombinase XerC [Klebsiella pneumoniae]EHK3587691.1 tyrosine-type recombinase/integrase [Escherichia coli]
MRASLLASLPYMMAEPTAFRWLCLQESLLKAPNTVEAYARGIDDWLRFCRQNDVSPTEASREILALYVRHLNISRNLAAASLRHRLTIVRLYCDYLREEGLIVLNPVMRGSWHPGGGGRRGFIQAQRRLPWIPSDRDWENLLIAARQTTIRNRFMLSLAYDCALRREELCSVATGDIDPSRRLLTVRAETTKTKRGRVVPYSVVTGELYFLWLAERRQLNTSRGPLFLSYSCRNRTAPITRWTWSKIVRSLAMQAGLPQLSTHTFRHLCLTDLARADWDIHEIATFAGHQSIQSTLLYIHLSARDLTEKFNAGMASIHEHRLHNLKGDNTDGNEN